jgi:hypothetical protein
MTESLPLAVHNGDGHLEIEGKVDRYTNEHDFLDCPVKLRVVYGGCGRFLRSMVIVIGPAMAF